MEMELTAPSGTFQPEDEMDIYQTLMEIAEEEGWDYRLQQPEDREDGLRVLQLGMLELGKKKYNILVELYLCAPQDSSGSYEVGQVLATLSDPVDEKILPELTRAILHVTNQTLAGHFGVSNNMLYYRQCVIIRADYPYAVSCQMLVDALVNVHQTLEASLDGMTDIAEGTETLESAIRKGELE